MTQKLCILHKVIHYKIKNVNALIKLIQLLSFFFEI